MLIFRLSVVTLVACLAFGPALADDAHHPPEATPQATPAPAPSPAPQTGRGMMGGQGMMGQGMMGHHQMMMGMMGSMGGMTGHVEGRIAFLRTEIKIANNQQDAWNGFAEAMRANAKKLAEARSGGMMAGPATLLERFEQQEKQLAARAEGLRGLKASYGRLAAVLSDEQKKLAEQLIPPHIGMMGGMM